LPALVLGLALAASDTTLSARAEGLLREGRLKEARTLLERGLRDRPHDPTLLMLLGRVHLDWPVIGRQRAWRLFEDAANRAPTDPTPRYLQMQVGLRLGGDDGERLARDAIFDLLALDPDYRDVWRVWSRLYHGSGHRRRAIAALARHDTPTARRRSAELLIELEEYRAADSVLASVERDRAADPALWALRAQAALERGDTAPGVSFYEQALRGAADDTAGVLWRQIAALASPEEEADYAVTPPESRAAYFRAFWARREPDLTTAVNERLVEHFLRLRAARKQFRILHPQTLFHRSPGWRALQGAAAGAVAVARQSLGTASDVLPGRSLFEDEIQALGLGVDARDLPEPDSLTRYARHGLDGRGLLYLRFGAPMQRQVARGGDVESWRYEVDGRQISLVFARATAASAFRGGSVMMGGDFVIYPSSQRDVHNATLMLERDATSMPADLPLDAWAAFFRSDDPLAGAAGREDVVVAVGADTAVVALWDARDREIARVRGASPLVLRAPPGSHRLGADARQGGRLGRMRGTIDIPSFAPGWLAISSLLAGLVTDTAPDRLTMARAMPADRLLRLDGHPLTLYAELYDLPTRDGWAAYEVEYAFEPVGRGARVTFAFVRVVPGATTVAERLVVQPGHIEPGIYRVTLTARDRVLGLVTPPIALTITLR
jgi:GWxTD domain-containing protein